MKKLLLLSRVTGLAALVIFINAVGLFLIGVIKSIKGLSQVFSSVAGSEWQMPGMMLAESTDSILLGLVLFILSLSIVKIFSLPGDMDDTLPGWLKATDLKELKIMVWEALLLTMTMIFATEMFSYIHRLQEMDWQLLILPVAILVLSLGLKFIKQ